MHPDSRNENEAMSNPLITARSTESIDVVRTRSGPNASPGTSPRACIHRDVLRRLAIERKLSPREQQIFALLTRGLSGKAIASELNCSHATVRTLQVRIQRKFACHSSPELLASVLEELLVIVNKLTT